MNAGMRFLALLAVLAAAVALPGADLATSFVGAAIAATPSTGTVYTADGGRIRGTILEAGPAGVSVQIADGSTRKFEAAAVKRVDFTDGTSWAPTAAQPQATAAAAPAAAPASAAPAAAPTASSGAGGPTVVPAAAPAPAAKEPLPIVLPIDRLDTVYLANGGRVRGLVLEEVPSEGLLMRLIDGSERRYKPGEALLVQYANGTVSPQPKVQPKAP